MEPLKTAFVKAKIWEHFPTLDAQANALGTYAKAEKLRIFANECNQAVLNKTLPNWKLEYNAKGIESGNREKENLVHQSHRKMERRTARIEKVMNRQLDAIKDGRFKGQVKARPPIANAIAKARNQQRERPAPQLQTRKRQFAMHAQSTLTHKFNRSR